MANFRERRERRDKRDETRETREGAEVNSYLARWRGGRGAARVAQFKLVQHVPRNIIKDFASSFSLSDKFQWSSQCPLS